MVWYDLRKPVHAELHSDYMQPLAELKARSKNRIQGIRHLVQNLRLIKSPAEIERMKIAGRVTAEVMGLYALLMNQCIPLMRWHELEGELWSDLLLNCSVSTTGWAWLPPQEKEKQEDCLDYQSLS